MKKYRILIFLLIFTGSSCTNTNTSNNQLKGIDSTYFQALYTPFSKTEQYELAETLSLTNHPYYLTVVINPSMCGMCIKRILLDAFLATTNTDQLELLIVTNQLTEKIEKLTSDYQDYVRHIPSNPFRKIYEQYQLPFVATLNSHGKISHIYFPEVFPEYNEMYFHFIKESY